MKQRFKAWEIGFLIFGLALSGGAATCFLAGIPLRYFVMGWKDGQTAEPVGKLSGSTGPVRRQLNSETEFASVKSGSVLYNLDTLVTGPEGSAKVQLDGGGVIELAPNTMVKLVFESRLSLGGISRAATVDVVSGSAKGDSQGGEVILRSGDKVVQNARDGIQVKQPVTRQVRKRPVTVAQLLKPDIPMAALMPQAPPSPTPAPSPSPSPSPSATPSPSPSPEEPPAIVRIISPERGIHLNVPKGSDSAELSVALEWSSDREHYPFEIVLKKESFNGWKEIARKEVAPSGQRGALGITLKSPGNYAWEVRKAKAPQTAKALATSQFVLNPEFEGIETLNPLVGGQSLESSQYNGQLLQKFDITLRWKKWGGQPRYTVRLISAADGKKPLLEKEVAGDSYMLNRGKVYTGRIFYRVSSTLPNGFVVNSQPTPFIFSFLAPVPVYPAKGAAFSKAKLNEGSKSIVMTWQKTNFTDAYEIEIASDNEFKQNLVRQRVRENFFVLRAPPVGHYWWRVKSFAKEVTSPSSEPYSLDMNP